VSTDHTFLHQLAQGTLPLEAFKYFLIQDYHFLTHFSRSLALGAYKSTSLRTISAAAEMIAHIQTEAKLHRAFCSDYGISNDELDHGEEDLACVAYTRWVTDVGTSQDWYGLQMALMPCLLGYGAIGRRLFDDKETVRGDFFNYTATLMKDGNPYFRWIENYIADDYTEAVKASRKLLEENAVKLSPERVEEMVETFREGTKLEGCFWDMAIEHRR